MGSPSAIDDILNNPRFQGAIDSISGVTGFADSIFVMFISFIAFFIISAALLRNVVAGAYAAYPKFFDMVSEAKEAGLNKVSGTRFGPIAAFFLRLVPDFKDLSDFHDDSVEPKHYFMKAIPQMIGVVMIGVVIYNGYYRDAVSVTAGFGSQLISRVLLNVDPVAVFDRLANSSGNPTFANDSNTTPKGKLINNLSEDVYSKIISFYTDINGEQAKSDLGRQIEDWVTAKVESLPAEYLENDAYSIKRQVTRVSGDPSIDGISASSTEIMKMVAFKMDIPNELQFSSTKAVGENWWLRIILRFDKEAAKAPVTGKSSSLTMNVPKGNVSDNGKTVIIKPSSASGTKFTAGSGSGIKINGKTATINSDGSLTIESYTLNGKATAATATNLFYTDSAGNSSQIKNINLNASGTGVSFKDNNGKLSDFKWGEVPVEK